MLRIAFITYEFLPQMGIGGIGTYMQQVSEAMSCAGFEVHVFAGSHQTGTYLENKVYIHTIQSSNPFEFRSNVVESFAAINTVTPFHLIESAEIHGNAWEVKKKFPSIPLIVRLHAPNHLVESLKKKYIPFLSKLRFVSGSVLRSRFDAGYWKKYNFYNDPDYQFLQSADFITAPSVAMKQWAIKNWQISAYKIKVIPNIFIPPQTLINIPVAAEPGYKRILFFGRLNPLKGLVNATRAIRKILKKHSDWKFIVIGDDGAGPTADMTMRSWMKEKLKKVSSQVEFTDSLPYENLQQAISECEIVLLPSLFESFSYACAEALAAGKAVIGSKIGGMADLIQNNENGVLINPDSDDEIYSALERLITDSSFRHRLSLSAKEKIINELNTNNTTSALIQFYHTIITKEFAENKDLSFS